MRLIRHCKDKPSAKELVVQLLKQGATNIRIVPAHKGFDIHYTKPTPLSSNKKGGE